MSKKDFLLALGERSVNPVDTDELLRSKISERKRREVERQEEIDEQQHKSKLAELKKKETSAEAAVEKTGEKKSEELFKISGGVNLGTIDLQAERKEAKELLEKMKKDADEAAAATGQENLQLREQVHIQQIKVLETSFKAQMDALSKAMETSSSRGNFVEQLAAARAVAEELGYQKGNIGGSGSELIQVELKKLDFEHQVAMRRMIKDDKAEERRWQLELRRLDDERDAKREELRDKKEFQKGQLTQDAQRNDMIAKAPAMIGNVFAQALMANQGKEGGVAQEATGEALPETKAPKGKQEKHVEAGWGDSGEVECPGCSQPLAIGPTATVAVCANCGQKVPIRRVGEKPAAREAPPSSQTSSQTTSQTSAPQAAKAPKRKQKAYIETGWGESGEVECPLCNQPIFINKSAFEAVCLDCGQSIEVRRSGQKPTFPLDEGA